MPAWIHNRAEHILAKNPSMKKETAFAIATQQSHKMGKTPKGYGTAKGKREAKAKYDQPKKEYVKSPNPGNLETPKLSDKPTTRWTGSKLVKKSAVPSLGWTYGMGPKLVREAASGAKEAVRSKLKKTVGSVKKITGLEKKAGLQRAIRIARSVAKDMEGLESGEQIKDFSKYIGRGKALQRAVGKVLRRGKRYDVKMKKTPGSYEAASRIEPITYLPTVWKSANQAALERARAVQRMRPMGKQSAVIMSKEADQIPGGKADKKTDADFDSKQMAMGEKIEMEHTNDRAKAREIARDHLEEFPDYYTRLKKMEQQAEKAKEASADIYSFCDEVLHLMKI